MNLQEDLNLKIKDLAIIVQGFVIFSAETKL